MKMAYNAENLSDSFETKINSLKNISTETYLSDYIISIKDERDYCVGRADMLNANKIISVLGHIRAVRYYQLFMNSMSHILDRFGGYVIKNVEGSLLYYFPESEKKDKMFGFMSCIECGLEMIQIHSEINKNAILLGLPNVFYNISADYGRVAIVNEDETGQMDLLGAPMDGCSKISNIVPAENFVIGKKLYEIVKDCDEYKFKKTQVSPKFEHDDCYIVTRNKEKKMQHVS